MAAMATSNLDQLLAMGFDSEKAQMAISKSGGLQGAIDWLEANQDMSIEEIKAAEAASAGLDKWPENQDSQQPHSLICNECGKKFRTQEQAEFHASKTEHTDFSESTEEIAPLTEEEKKARLVELREKLAAKRALQSEQDKVDKKRNEEIRRKSTKESQDMKEELQRKEVLKEVAKKKQEKLDDIEARRRIKAQIEADKAERRERAEREKLERAGLAPPSQPPSAPLSTTSSPATSKASAYAETRLRLKTPKGNVMKTLPVTTTLFEVAHALNQDDGIAVRSFTQTFPKKIFDAECFGETLKDLGLVPSASLIVQ